ncbi:MAG: DUF721 domain-containing protein [Verrucomicrobia bacterium]|nr:DUF721 domain-containing protein [Verrucomicrobiota bacterium]
MSREEHFSNKGRWELERERHQIDDERPPPPPEKTASVADHIPGFLQKLGLEDRMWEQVMLEEWFNLVGPQVARHARPGRVNRKVLHIYVTNSTWLNELARYMKDELLANIQKRFGKERITDIRFQLDPEGGHQ